MSAYGIWILLAISSASFVIGLLLFNNPAQAITFQKKFYARINWNIEPVSMPKELRNTRIMGAGLLLISLATVGYLITGLRARG